MKKLTAVITVLITGLFTLQMTQAQGTLYVSNLGDNSIGSTAVGSDSWVGQYFVTGTNSGGYFLNSVQLSMLPASGSPGGFTVSLYSYDQAGVHPGLMLGSLSGLDPAAGGVFTYSTAGFMLLPSHIYVVVATADTPVAQGAYNWSARPGVSQGDTLGDERWRIGHLNFTSTDGLNWDYARNQYFQMALYATPVVPEPAASALFVLGLAGLGLWRRQNRPTLKP